MHKQLSNRTVEEIVDDLTLFDDDLMSLVFDNNIEATNLLLRIILNNENLNVLKVTGQRELENPIVNGRNLRLDILAQDSEGKLYDIEVQRDSGGAHVRRARFHSSMIDVRMLKEKATFRNLRDSYVIFITQKDYMEEGIPLYHITRFIKETKVPFNDGSHIIYVNGAYRNNDALGKLMHDFSCKNSSEVYYVPLRKGIEHFKEKGGRITMCKAVEEYGKSQAIMETIKHIKNLMETTNWSAQQAMDALKISKEEQKALLPMLNQA